MRLTAIIVFLALMALPCTAEPEQMAGYWLQKGDEFADKGSYELADNCYNKVLELDPDNVSAWRGKSMALAYINRSEESIFAANNAVNLDPENIDVWVAKGLAQFIIARNNKTLGDASVEILNGSVGHKETWTYPFIILGYIGGVSASLITDINTSCENALVLENPEGEPYDALLGIGDLGPLQVLYPEIGYWKVKVYGNDVPTENNTFQIILISYFYKVDEDGYNESLKSADRALKLNPNNIQALNLKARILSGSNRFNEAILVIDKSLKLDPLNAWTWYLKGVIFENHNRYEQSLQYFDNAIDLDPYYEDAYSSKASVLTKLDRTEEAEYVREKAQDLR